MSLFTPDVQSNSGDQQPSSTPTATWDGIVRRGDEFLDSASFLSNTMSDVPPSINPFGDRTSQQGFHNTATGGQVVDLITLDSGPPTPPANQRHRRQSDSIGTARPAFSITTPPQRHRRIPSMSYGEEDDIMARLESERASTPVTCVIAKEPPCTVLHTMQGHDAAGPGDGAFHNPVPACWNDDADHIVVPPFGFLNHSTAETAEPHDDHALTASGESAMATH